MKIFILLHDEDGSEIIRGLYQEQAHALRDLPVQIVEVEGVALPMNGGDVWKTGYCTTIEHTEDCCYVVESDVRAEPIGAVALPKPPSLTTPRGSLIPDWVAHEMAERLMAQALEVCLGQDQEEPGGAQDRRAAAREETFPRRIVH